MAEWMTIQRGECLSKVFKDRREITKETGYFYVIVVIYKFVFHISYDLCL